MKKNWLIPVAIAAAYAIGRAQGPAGVAPSVAPDVKLENNRVRVTELDYHPAVPREKSIRKADQVIVFLDDSRYERIDPDTGAKEIRTRKSGDVIWHFKGEVAPVLTNQDKKTYRTLVIELK